MATCNRFTKTNPFISLLALGLVCVCFAAPVDALTIVGSKHDFTSTASGTNNFADNFFVPDPATGFPTPIDQVCVFCHTPHHAALGAAAPLWNRTSSPPDATYTFKMYTSESFTYGPVGGPTGISALCMSCHDGVSSIAVSTLLNPPGDATPDQVTTSMSSNGAIGAVYNGDPLTNGWGANLGNIDPLFPGTKIIDLSNDHPISFVYPTSASGIYPSTSIDTRLRLFGASKDMVECATCHLVHDNQYEPFLAMPNNGSQMCLSCHQK
ncbi:MAG: hypothetical protein OEW15_01760 [Nitrospirota bacterium]|nr:hypothetical protein [Nitrospirota bacterium]